MTDVRSITEQLGGRWYGRYGTAPCPCCQFEGRRDQDALTITDGDGRVLMHCKKTNCHIKEIRIASGLSSGDYTPRSDEEIAQRNAEAKLMENRKAAQAAICWKESQPIAGTIAETYLRGRGITAPFGNCLRFHPDAWHGPTAQRLPAMVAAVSVLHGSSSPAVHRTYLSPDGSRKADVQPVKMMLGRTAGGGVALSDGAGPLVVCEGIETGLSLLSGLLEGPAKVVAALYTSGLKSLTLPGAPGTLILAPDGDSAGHEASEALGLRAQGAGWQVHLLAAPEGCDWNDILRAGGL